MSSLDVGSTHAKAAVCLVDAGRVFVLGQGIAPYAGDTRSMEMLSEACDTALTQAEDMTDDNGGRKVVADRVVVGVGAVGVSAEAQETQYERRSASDPLSEDEFLRILTGIQRSALNTLVARASTNMQKPRLLLPACGVQVLLDGRRVDNPMGLRAHMVEVRTFNALMSAASLEAIETLVNRLQLDPPEIVLLAEAVPAAWQGILGPDGIGVDIGGRHTAVMVWKDGMLRGLVNVPQGGRDLTVSLGRACQADEERAEKLKLSYSHGQFDADQRAWIGGLLQPALTRWLNRVIQALRDLAGGEPLPPAIWVWGGGAELTDSFAAARALAQQGGLRFAGHPSVRLLDENGSSRVENRSGASMHLLGINVNAAPCALGSPMTAPALVRRLRKATLTVCQAEQISYWIPVDG